MDAQFAVERSDRFSMMTFDHNREHNIKFLKVRCAERSKCLYGPWEVMENALFYHLGKKDTEAPGGN